MHSLPDFICKSFWRFFYLTFGWVKNLTGVFWQWLFDGSFWGWWFDNFLNFWQFSHKKYVIFFQFWIYFVKNLYFTYLEVVCWGNVDKVFFIDILFLIFDGKYFGKNNFWQFEFWPKMKLSNYQNDLNIVNFTILLSFQLFWISATICEILVYFKSVHRRNFRKVLHQVKRRNS